MKSNRPTAKRVDQWRYRMDAIIVVPRHKVLLDWIAHVCESVENVPPLDNGTSLDAKMRYVMDTTGADSANMFLKSEKQNEIMRTMQFITCNSTDILTSPQRQALDVISNYNDRGQTLLSLVCRYEKEPVEKIAPEHTLPIILQLNRRVRKKTKQACECRIDMAAQINALERAQDDIEEMMIQTNAIVKFIDALRDACKVDNFLHGCANGKYILDMLPRDIRVKIRRPGVRP